MGLNEKELKEQINNAKSMPSGFFDSSLLQINKHLHIIIADKQQGKTTYNLNTSS